MPSGKNKKQYKEKGYSWIKINLMLWNFSIQSIFGILRKILITFEMCFFHFNVTFTESICIRKELFLYLNVYLNLEIILKYFFSDYRIYS